MVSQMIALITGIPDFLVGAKKLNDGLDFMKASMERSWGMWAKKQTNALIKKFFLKSLLL